MRSHSLYSVGWEFHAKDGCLGRHPTFAYWPQLESKAKRMRHDIFKAAAFVRGVEAAIFGLGAAGLRSMDGCVLARLHTGVTAIEVTRRYK